MFIVLRHTKEDTQQYTTKVILLGVSPLVSAGYSVWLFFIGEKPKIACPSFKK
jgi:hypothetical protein